MKKDVQFSGDGREKLMEGVNIIGDAVGVTLGAKGRNVIIERENDYPQITKDGVTVAKSIELIDSVMNMGVDIIKEVASKTHDVAGDGTTTATVLAQAIMNEGMKHLKDGVNPVGIKRGIDKAVAVVVDKIKELARPVNNNDTLKQIASISSNGDASIGNVIAKAFEITGNDGIITVEESRTHETNITTVEGLQINRGFISPFFITDPKKEKCELEKPVIILLDDKISVMKDFLGLLSLAVDQGSRPLLVIAEDVEGEALATLVVNKMKGAIKVCCVKSPDFGKARRDTMEDIAILTGGTFISEVKGMKLADAGTDVLGQCERVVVEKEKTTIVGGYGTKIQERCEELKELIKNSDNELETEVLKSRLAKFTNGVAVINVGAVTEFEMKEKKDRVDDALRATKAATEEGYIAGGGVTYLKCLEAIATIVPVDDEEKVGIEIMEAALQEPFIQILFNAGIESDDYIIEVRGKDYGFGMNVKTGIFENLLETGVIDPAKVARVALENAASIAGLFLTTECVISIAPRSNVM